MSKPLFRVAVTIVVVLVIVAGVYVTVQAASSSLGASRGRVDKTASDSYYLNQQRGISEKLSPYFDNSGSGHDCEREGENPNDY